MGTALALLAGLYFAVGVYLVLADQPVRVALGVGILAQAGMFAMLTAGRLMRDRPPILGEGSADIVANPLSQAYAVTALGLALAVTATLAAMLLGAPKEDV